jgi:hypothetical protein
VLKWHLELGVAPEYHPFFKGESLFVNVALEAYERWQLGSQKLLLVVTAWLDILVEVVGLKIMRTASICVLYCQ